MIERQFGEWVRGRLWIAVAAGCVPWLVWLGGLASTGGKQDWRGQLVGADHLAFYHAAHLVRAGESYRLYNFNELAEEKGQQALIGWDWNGYEAFRNPPFFALVFLPNSYLSFYASFVVWSAVGLALLALAILLLKPESPRRAFLWSLTFYPVFATISFGQNSLIGLAIFAGVYRLLANDRRFAAGLLAGLLFFKPQLLLGVFVWWAFNPRRHARSWLGLFVTGCALAALSWLVLPGGTRAFLITLLWNLGYSEFGQYNVMTTRAFFSLLLNRPEAYWPLSLCCSAAGAAVAWRVSRRTGDAVAAMFPVAVFLSVWISPHALVYEWAIVVAAAVVLWEKFPASRDTWLCVFALAWLALAVSAPLTNAQLRSGWPIAVQVGVPVLGLAGWLAARELARSAEARARPTNEQPVMTA